MPTPVSATSIRAPSGVARDVDRDRPAARRELDRVGDEVGHDLADPLRVVADPDRGVGQVQREVDAATSSGGARSARRPISTAARRSSGRRSSRTSPESSFESSSRFWASQSSRSICWPLDSRNSARASGSSAAPSRQQLVERAQRRERRPQLVRDVGQEVAAPVAVAADDLDALLEPVGHGVELDGELGQLGRAGADLARPARAGSGRPRRGRARPRSGGAAAS